MSHKAGVGFTLAEVCRSVHRLIDNQSSLYNLSVCSLFILRGIVLLNVLWVYEMGFPEHILLLGKTHRKQLV